MNNVVIKNEPELPLKFVHYENYYGDFIGFANVTIYNVLGKKIITLVNNQQTAGYKPVAWNGFDKSAIDMGAYVPLRS